jgi:hypothetical protein
VSTVEAPPHPFIRPVDPTGLGERVCHVCGHGPDGDKVTPDGVIPGRRFVEFRVAGVDAVDPGRVYTRHDEPGVTVTTVRGADGPVAIRHEHMVICEECLTVSARLLGLSEQSFVQAEADRWQQATEDARGEAALARKQLEQLREGVRVAQSLTTLLDAEKSEPKPTRRSSRGTA